MRQWPFQRQITGKGEDLCPPQDTWAYIKSPVSPARRETYLPVLSPNLPEILVPAQRPPLLSQALELTFMHMSVDKKTEQSLEQRWNITGSYFTK